MKKKKKGNIFNLVLLIVILFIAALFGLLSYSLSNKITTAYKDSTFLGDENSTAYKANEVVRLNLPYIADEFIFFLFLGGNIALVIAASRTNFSPAVIFLFILMSIIAIAIAAGMTNIYQGLASDSNFTDEHASLKLTNIIFGQYTPLIFCILSAVILGVMYSKSGNNGGF